jgi:hypothetical protein
LHTTIPPPRVQAGVKEGGREGEREGGRERQKFYGREREREVFIDNRGREKEGERKGVSS